MAAPTVTGIVEFVNSIVFTTEVGTAASLVSLVLTMWVIRSIKNLRSHFLFTARLPQLLEELERDSNGLSAGLTEQEEWADIIDIELVRCRANLTSLAPKIKGPTQKSARALVAGIDKYLSEDRTKSGARAIKIRLNGLLQELHNLHEDTKWGE